ncbi:hypothetical protein NA56DRAFT_709380 [Hyaloscypha hepaticicola]|uniref:F-box domain-containing protein n=1 Tax=Hyaloscypha hepaticicola TaxID=2082293 RepID=A0A2J6PPP5_9HELO|nr:hypothetical protein NA56DRAFT_709380 [Hyaloscypha hepaticicola]
MLPQITRLQKAHYPDLPAVIPQPPNRPWNRKPKPLPPVQRKYTSSLVTLNGSSTKPRSNSLLIKLPNSLLLLIISNLDRVTSACLGLTSYRLYLLHFSVHGKVGMKENTVYTIEVLDGPWKDGGNKGFRMLGPMTTVKSSSLKEMLLPVGTRERGGGREWDASLGYFRRAREVEHEDEVRTTELRTQTLKSSTNTKIAVGHFSSFSHQVPPRQYYSW